MKQLGEDQRRYALMPEITALEESLVTAVVAELKTRPDYLDLPDQQARLSFIKQQYTPSYSLALRIEESWFFSLEERRTGGRHHSAKFNRAEPFPCM